MNPISIAALAFLVVSTAAARAQVDSVFVTKSRGQDVRSLLVAPAGTPKGAVILLAGGHGNLRLSPGGDIGWGRGNQMVRTRANYAKAGYLSLVPDIAPDLKQGEGVKSGSRYSEEFATDIGAHVVALRAELAKRGVAGGRVHLLGTSRGALTVSKAAATLTGPARPDTVTITAGMIAHVDPTQPSAEKSVGNLARIKQPVLLVHHEKDGCAYTPASAVPRASQLFTGAKSVTVRMLSGGNPGSGDPCDANSHHGFLGLDPKVVETIVDWIEKTTP